MNDGSVELESNSDLGVNIFVKQKTNTLEFMDG